MRPTYDQIRVAAYDRWERRGRAHGSDREDWCAAERELTFLVNYETIADYPLDSPIIRVLGEGRLRRCRFCERTSDQTSFGPPRPVAAGLAGQPSLLAAQVCDDCQADWHDGLEGELHEFWRSMPDDLSSGRSGLERRRGPTYSVGVFKALVAGALLILPEAELPFFVDTLEWVSNPDHDADDRLLDEGGCQVYTAPFLREKPRATLARRVDPDAPLPYLLYFLSCDGIMIQVPLPMCLRDQDLDGLAVHRPERALAAGWGPDFREARGMVLPLALSGRRANRARRPSSIAC